MQHNKLPVVSDSDTAILYIKEIIGNAEKPALLLSSGMDSAVLLPYMQKGATAYTIYHEGLDDSEVEIAKQYCEKFSINHTVISINPDEYFSVMDDLMISKKMPLSPAEPIFYIAAKQIKQDGFKEVVTGGAADARFGGFARFRKLRSSYRYQKRLQSRYLCPSNILKKRQSLNYIFDQYLMSVPKNASLKKTIRSFSPRKRDHCVIDFKRFLSEIGVERFAYDNAISLAGCEHIAPFTKFYFDIDEKLNVERPKYFIQDLYYKIYDQEAPPKSGLQKPTHMLGDYCPSNFDLFKKNIDMTTMTYPQKFMIYCLERFEALRLEGKIKAIDS